VGKKNVKSIEDATLCILTDSNGYAVLVVATDYADEGSSFIAYVTDGKAELYNRSLGDGHFVYKMGETTPTTVWTGKGTFDYENTGLYSFKLDANGIITEMKYLLQDLTKDGDYSMTKPALIDRVAIKADELGTSFQAYGYSGLKEDKTAEDFGYSFTAGAAIKDYNVTDDTKVILVTKTAMDGTAVLEEGSMADVKADSIAFVKYTAIGRIYNADVIYVFVNTGFAPTPVAPKYTFAVKKVTMDTENGATIVLTLLRDGKPVVGTNPVSKCNVTIFNKNNVEVYASTLDDENLTAEGSDDGSDITITVNNTLTEGAEYRAVIDLVVGKTKVSGTVATAYYEAQTTTAQ
jgi:hypothetical protein